MKKEISILVCLLISVGLHAQPGTLDLTFNPGDLGFGHGDGPNDYVCAAVSQPDGKILIGGAFATYNDVPRSMIARIHADGTLDHTFDPGSGIGSTSGMSYVETIQVLTNGKILVGGIFNLYNGQAVNNLIQLNTDGSLDMDFDIGTGPNNAVTVIRQQADGRILMGGRFTSYNNVEVSYLARIHPNGSIDSTFQGPDYEFNYDMHEILLLADERILIGGDFAYTAGTSNHYIIRLMGDGSLDSTFNTNFTPVQIGWGFETPFVRRIQVIDENKYLVAGRLVIPDMDYNGCILRLNEDGSLDEEFEILSMTPFGSFYPTINVLIPRSQGKFLISGSFSSVNGIQYRQIAMIHSNGTLDTSFEPDEPNLFNGLIYQTGNQLLISSDYANNIKSYLLRIHEDFSIDHSFNPVTGANARIQSLAIDDDGKIYIGGHFQFFNNTSMKGIARLLTDGSLDQAFDPGSGTNTGSHIFSLLPLLDGKILAGGYFTSFDCNSVKHLACLNSDGSVNSSFNAEGGADGGVIHLAIDGGGKIIVTGTFIAFNDQPMRRIARLNQDGSLDETFVTGEGANNRIMCSAVQNDGKIIIGGHFEMFNGMIANKIARLNTDGSLDVDFNTGHGFHESVSVMALGIQSDGKIIVASSFSLLDSIPMNGIVRLNTNGSRDNTFTPGSGPNGVIESLLIQPDDKIIIGGFFTLFDSLYAGRIARLEPDGSLDTTFQIGSGFNNRVEEMALQDDGNILVCGWFTAYNGTGRNRIARILGGEPDGVRSDFKTALINVYPNPATNVIHIESENFQRQVTIRIYDLQGRIIADHSNSNGYVFRVDVSRFNKGIYFIEVVSGEMTGKQKFIKH
jgi:uncharacterized delta-60 repeat protein